MEENDSFYALIYLRMTSLLELVYNILQDFLFGALRQAGFMVV